MKPKYGRPNPSRLNDTQAIATKPVSQDFHIDLNCYPFSLENAAYRRFMENGRFAPKPADRDGGLKSATSYLGTIKGDCC